MTDRRPDPADYLRIADVPSFPNGQATLVRVRTADYSESFVCRIDDKGFLRTFDPHGPKYIRREGYEVAEVVDD